MDWKERIGVLLILIFICVTGVVAETNRYSYSYDPKRALSVDELRREFQDAAVTDGPYVPSEADSIEALAGQISSDLERLRQRIRRWHETHPGQVYNAHHVIACDLGYLVDRVQKEIIGEVVYTPQPLIFEVKMPEAEFVQGPAEYL